MTIDAIPKEIFHHIAYFVPKRDLNRMELVCKKWKSLLDNQTFYKRYAIDHGYATDGPDKKWKEIARAFYPFEKWLSYAPKTIYTDLVRQGLKKPIIQMAATYNRIYLLSQTGGAHFTTEKDLGSEKHKIIHKAYIGVIEEMCAIPSEKNVWLLDKMKEKITSYDSVSQDLVMRFNFDLMTDAKMSCDGNRLAVLMRSIPHAEPTALFIANCSYAMEEFTSADKKLAKYSDLSIDGDELLLFSKDILSLYNRSSSCCCWTKEFSDLKVAIRFEDEIIIGHSQCNAISISILKKCDGCTLKTLAIDPEWGVVNTLIKYDQVTLFVGLEKGFRLLNLPTRSFFFSFNANRHYRSYCVTAQKQILGLARPGNSVTLF